VRQIVEASLSTAIDRSIVEDLLGSYERLIAENRLGDHAAALMQAGRFVEHTFRAIEYVRTGKAPALIKSVAAAMRTIEADTAIVDSLRILIPRVAYGMIYDIRSKRNAVHVNEIDPSPIDTALAASAAGWILAELLRLYHSGSEREIARTMSALTQARLPLVEVILDEALVSAKVPVNIELLLLLANAAPNGLTRSDLGKSAKCSASSVTRSLQALEADRLIHKARDGAFYPTGAGEIFLSSWLLEQRYQ
jgi:hypothetical protein